jgi:predicted MFS family arabinose efflux permease
MSTPSTTPLTPALVWLMSAATGLAVAGNYYAQPLLPAIAHEMGISAAGAGSIVTTAQLGYAVGLLLIVPLGDLFERRRLIVSMTVLSALGLLLTALSTSMTGLLVGTALAGTFSVVAQLLVPLAATLAQPENRGKVLGTVMSGLLMGILLARTVSGLVAGLGGWRAIYWVGAVAMLLVALLLARRLPRYQHSVGLSYPRLLLSVLALFKQEPTLRLRAFLGATSFAAFSVLWTSMAFLLAAPPYNFSTVTIGLFGLAGAAGALAAPVVGRLGDKGRGEQATLAGMVMLLLSWLPLALAPKSLWALLVGVLLLDLAVQGVNVSNQAAIYRLQPDARNRLTSAYMTCYFIGGASGSLASAAAYGVAGWNGVCMVGAAVCLSGLLVWGLARRSA